MSTFKSHKPVFTLHGKGNSAGVIKLRISTWIIWVAQMFYKGTHRGKKSVRGENVKTEARLRVMWDHDPINICSLWKLK